MSQYQSMIGSTITPLEALDDLKEDEFERFVFFLSRVKEMYINDENIQKRKLHKKSRVEVAGTMIETYGNEIALQVTIKILKHMKEYESARTLEKQIQQKRKESDSIAVPVKKQRLANESRETCQPASVKKAQDLQSVMTKHKDWLKHQSHFIVEETAKDKNKIPLNYIYTDLIITKGESEARNNEHEVLMNDNSQFSYESGIHCNDIFGKNEEEIKTVLTKGVAGIGKTVSVQKFILDWAENKANQDVEFLFVLPFRQLNLIEGDYSLHELLVHLHPQLKDCHSDMYVDKKILFIFDGLEESRIQLSFRQTSVSDVHTKCKVEVLIINLIKGELLPSALIWITSRPAAASQIPSQYIHRVTEIQGFSDSQKEQYFRKRVTDPDEAKRIILHIKKAKSLHIMCHIPVFCWISVTALQPWLSHNHKKEIPTTLTEMYSYFLLVQMNRKNEKFDQSHDSDTKLLLEYNKNMILKLAELAFRQLLNGNVLFYKKDLEECGINVQESFLYSGICTEIFKIEPPFYRTKVYCFVHLSFQEFFAALYVFHCYLCKNTAGVKMFLPKTKVVTKVSLDVLMKHAVDEALKSKNGHLDLFLRFLHGLSLESNQRLLQGLLPCTESSPESVQKIKQNLKRGQKKNINPERWLNLSHCLIEMKDDTLQQEIQTYLQSNKKSKKLTLAQCSAMANMFQVSEEAMDELDLKKYNTTEEGRRRLIPALRNCKKAILADCNLTENACENIASALQSANSPLRELDLSNNDLQETGLKLLYEGLKNCKLEILRLSNCKLTTLSALLLRNSSLRKLDLSYNNLQKGIDQLSGLKSPNCKLDTLRISDCKLTAESCKSIGKALAKSPLRELDLSCNDLQDTGMKLLSDGLMSSHCNLNILKLSDCKLTEQSCTHIASVLKKANSSLRELDLSDNDLLDSGIKVLSGGLKSSQCVLEILRLSGCCLTEQSCSSLILALHSNPTHLTELDLNYNHLGRSELQFFSVNRKLKTRTNHSGELRIAKGLKKYAFKLTLDPNTANTRLSLTNNNTRMLLMKEDQPCRDNRLRFQYVTQVLSTESLSGRCYWEVEWHQNASIAVAYKSISKRGHRNDCVFGCSKKSWSLDLSRNNRGYNVYSVMHNKESTPSSYSQFNRVGVYVDVPAGILSFYAISSDSHKLTRIHTFRTTFTERLFAGFGLKLSNDSISLIRS
ncbi:NACHT, LRR and PYD domains-containing protein 12-like isoform X1 [Tachysurus fulvidraco]|uniref:NACHT, LRR and PYD domains-containing protein 12-like isoform X1 n=1 Tax=Tachysurus fulvidraco TaxID=1234273 RepID=UPI001FEF76AF|nr:NACHT, LRR and PYD domains-containing protein 12-like isoform X1 [Tachysurus fulvidraco]